MVSACNPDYQGVASERQFYVYDAWNRLKEVWRDTDGDGTKEVSDYKLATYSYDGLGRRIRKDDQSGESQVVYDYYYNTSWQILEERKDSHPNYAYKQYVWCQRYIDAPVVRFRDTNCDGDVDDTLYYCSDANMNVTALVNTDGEVVERYDYDPYGQVTVLDADWTVDDDGASDYDNEILYCGYRYDPETGLYCVRHRMYHPTLGRWTSREPGGVYRDGMNLYEYGLSSPTRYVDPQGLAGQEGGTCLSLDKLEDEIGKAGDEHKKARCKLRKAMDDWGGEGVADDNPALVAASEEVRKAWLSTRWWAERWRKRCSPALERSGLRWGVPMGWVLSRGEPEVVQKVGDAVNSIIGRLQVMRDALDKAGTAAGILTDIAPDPTILAGATALPYLGKMSRKIMRITDTIHTGKLAQGAHYDIHVLVSCVACLCKERTNPHTGETFMLREFTEDERKLAQMRFSARQEIAECGINIEEAKKRLKVKAQETATAACPRKAR